MRAVRQGSGVDRVVDAMGMAAPVPPGGRVPATIEPSVARTILVEGVVQGVGFRPFVWRLATELGLAGRVRNAAGRVEVEAAGPAAALDAFARRLRTDAPPRARVERVTVAPLDPASRHGPAHPVRDRRERRPPRRPTACSRPTSPPATTACASCSTPPTGATATRSSTAPTAARAPRSSTSCPYDRAQTTMRAFPLCAACDAEYRDPADRRFHAEPVACADLRPAARLAAHRRAGARSPRARTRWRPRWRACATGPSSRSRASAATTWPATRPTTAAVRRLRDRKRRWAKPFAVMVRDLAAARALCRVGALERRLLEGPARPIVLLEARRDGEPALAPSRREREPAPRRLPALHAAPPPAARGASAARSCSPPATSRTSRWPPTTRTPSRGSPASRTGSSPTTARSAPATTTR